MKLLVFGPGYSARAAITHLRSQCDWIAATARNEAGAAVLQSEGIRPIRFGDAAAEEVRDAAREATHILVSIPPDTDGDPVLRVASDALGEATNVRSVVYLSTVGIYGDHDGAWVDEDTEPAPASGRSIARLEAETDWRSATAAFGWPLAILRLSGIYGPRRNALVNLAEGTARRIVKEGQVFNRIHVSDIAAAIDAAFATSAAGVFNVTDDLPAPPQEVVAYAAELMAIEPPAEIPFDAAELSPMARSFYGENKRVSNTRMKRELGVELAFPTYREGLRSLWLAGEGRTR